MTEKQKSQEQVREIMRELNGRCLNGVDGPNGSDLEFWHIPNDGPNSGLVIFQIWPEGGWEYYVAGRAHKLDEIVPDIRKYFSG